MRSASTMTSPPPIICGDSAEWVEALKACSQPIKKEQREKLTLGGWKHGRYRNYTQQGLCSRGRGHAGLREDSPFQSILSLSLSASLW